MDPGGQLVLAIARDRFGEEGAGEIARVLRRHGGELDWEGVRRLVSWHGIAPLAHTALEGYAGLVPDEVARSLKRSHYFSAYYGETLWALFLDLAEAARRARIDLVPIKGIALRADLYGADPSSRAMVDIDLLTREEAIPAMEGILRDFGYLKDLEGLEERYWRQRQCHLVFRNPKPGGGLPTPVAVDLHWGLDFQRGNRTLLPDLWSRVRRVEAEGAQVSLLSPEDTLFSLALHNRRFGKTLSLKYALDIAMLLGKHEPRFDWEYVIREGRASRTAAAIFFALCHGRLVSPAHLPATIGRDLGLPGWKARRIERFVERETLAGAPPANPKSLYLKSHFLLYDSLWEPAGFILTIPREQFAKFYGLAPYEKGTGLRHRLRLVYMPAHALFHKDRSKGRTHGKSSQ